MSDIRCAVCSEPWDTHHLRYDAPAWVRPLFMSGAGCESCEGQAPDSQADDRDMAPYLAHVADRITSPDDDDTTAGTDYHPRTRPEWKRPTDTLEWQCEGCSVCIKRNHDRAEGKEGAFYVDGVKNYYQERDLRIERDNEFSTLESAIETISHDGSSCSLCVYLCRDCSTLVGEDPFPCPDDKYSNSRLCEDCYSICEYECAIQSYDQSELIRALGYPDRVQGVGAWLDNRTLTFDQARDLELCEVEGPSLRYFNPNPHYLNSEAARKRKARVLWAIRQAVNE